MTLVRYHPRWHPYYQGRGIHTLQSVTKSIAATVIGVALGRGGSDRSIGRSWTSSRTATCRVSILA